MNNMKKRYISLITVLIVLALSALTYFIVLRVEYLGETDILEDAKAIDVFFIDTNLYQLVSEQRIVLPLENEKEDLIDIVMEFLSIKPVAPNLTTAIPEQVGFLYNYFDGKLTINFSQNYLELPPYMEVLSRAGIVETFIQLDIDNISFYVEGMPLLKTTGEPLGMQHSRNLVVNPILPSEEIVEVSRFIHFYFVNPDLSGLRSDRRLIFIASNRSVEEQVLEELFRRGAAEDNFLFMNPNTRILNISTQDTVAYVDLSSDFDWLPSQGYRALYLTINAIVYTLTALPEIEEVQFLIEAQIWADGYIDLSQSFKREGYLSVVRPWEED